MYILLLRHATSPKNISKRFHDPDEALGVTSRGIDLARQMGQALVTLSASRGISPTRIYSAESSMALQTSNIIADGLSVPVKTVPGLDSIRSAFPGSTEAEVELSHPRFYRLLTLYRSGLFNWYDLPALPGAEDCRAFERRVAAAFLETLASTQDVINVVVLHRSAITALLIRFARLHHSYPEAFYGYVELHEGSVSVLQAAPINQWKIAGVNITPATLSKHFPDPPE